MPTSCICRRSGTSLLRMQIKARAGAGLGERWNPAQTFPVGLQSPGPSPLFTFLLGHLFVAESRVSRCFVGIRISRHDSLTHPLTTSPGFSVKLGEKALLGVSQGFKEAAASKAMQKAWAVMVGWPSAACCLCKSFVWCQREEGCTGASQQEMSPSGSSTKSAVNFPIISPHVVPTQVLYAREDALPHLIPEKCNLSSSTSRGKA